MNKSLLVLDSRHSLTPNPSEAVWLINKEYLSGFSQIALIPHFITIRNSVYPINEYYNNLYFNEGAATLTGTIPAQRYTGITLATEIQTLMNALGANVYTVSYNASTSAISISATGNFLMEDGDNSVNEHAGFESSTDSFDTSFTGSHPVQLSGTKSVRVLCPMGGDNHVVGLNQALLVNVPMNVPFDEEVMYSFEQTMPILIKENSLREIRVSLRDDRDNPWTLPKNAHWEMSFLVHGEFAQNNTPAFAFAHTMRRPHRL